jgi:hypothetical protein
MYVGPWLASVRELFHPFAAIEVLDVCAGVRPLGLGIGIGIGEVET